MLRSRRELLRESARLASTALVAGSLESIRMGFDSDKQLTPEQAAQKEDLWRPVQDAYDVNRDFINLASAVRGVAPRVVSDAVIDTYRRVNEFRGGGNYTLETRDRVRKRLAAQVGCNADELALTRNTTDGVVTVLFGMKLKAGDEILTTDQEHEPFYGALYQRAAREGVAIKRVSIPTPAAQSQDLASAIETAITPRTRLIFVCHVYLSGQIFPVRQICNLVRGRGIQVLVDGALAFGHIPIDVKALGCDYYAASLHKWGGGPMGTGLFYARKEHVPTLPPLFGYFDSESRRVAFDSPRMEKYEQFGTHPAAMILSIGQMLDFIESIGQERIAARLHHLKLRWAEQIAGVKRIRFTASLDPQLSCSLLPFEVEGQRPRDIITPLRAAKIILGSAYTRGEFGRPETWRDIVLCNSALFTRVAELDIFAAALKRAVR
jgi:isopenicillin-N epimerase